MRATRRHKTDDGWPRAPSRGGWWLVFIGGIVATTAASATAADPSAAGLPSPSPGPSPSGARAGKTGGTPGAPVPAESEADPDAPSVGARVVPQQAHVGDPITLTITAIAKPGVSLNIPNVLELGPFTLLDRSEAQTDLGAGRVRREFQLRVAAYEPGSLSIPSVGVTYLGRGGGVRQVRTPAQPVKIVSLLANEPEPKLKEDAAPIPVLKRDLTLAYLGLGLLAAALGALVTWLVVRRMRSRVVYRPGPPPRPAHEIAMERLDRLGAYGFLENADNRPFYFAVSEIIRDYLGARFGFDSLELTTRELMAELRKRAGRELALSDIDGWLSASDLVKFAKVSPTATEARGTLESAIRIVESTRPRPVAPTAPGPTVAASGGVAASPAARADAERGGAEPVPPPAPIGGSRVR